MPQRHDIGYQKRLAARPPMEREALKLWRAKLKHPGPLPERFIDKEGEEESDGDYANRINSDNAFR